jgi:hypothetical protein
MQSPRSIALSLRERVGVKGLSPIAAALDFILVRGCRSISDISISSHPTELRDLRGSCSDRLPP